MKARTEIPEDILSQLRVAVDRAVQRVRDPEVVRKACERLDKMREEVRLRHGLLDIAVPAVREIRDP